MKKTAYAIGASIAAGSVANAVIILENPETTLTGNSGASDVDRMFISFDPLGETIATSVVNSPPSAIPDSTAFTISPQYYSPSLKITEDPSASTNASSEYSFSSVPPSAGTSVSASIGSNNTNLGSTNNQYLGVQYDDGSSNFFGWVEYSVFGPSTSRSVTIHNIAFETTPNLDIAVGASPIPEPEAVAGVLGLLAAGVVGMRKLRKNKQAS